MRRRGYTLVEVVIAALVGSVVLGGALYLLVSGSKLFDAGVAAARGPEAAVLLMDLLEEDLASSLQAPGDPRPPLKVIDGRGLRFYRTSPGRSTRDTMVGVPARWDVVDGHPVRDGEVLRSIALAGFEARLIQPDLGDMVPGWFLEVRARFPGTRRTGSEFELVRLIPLPQPSTNFLHFLGHGEELLPGTVRFLHPPEDLADDFEGLGPPDELLDGREGSSGFVSIFAAEGAGS